MRESEKLATKYALQPMRESEKLATCPRKNIMKPFLKWSGGKRQLLPELMKHAPDKFGTYWEPFLGGGALFWHLKPRRAVLSDVNERLVSTYRGIRTDAEKVIGLLQRLTHSREVFEDIRVEPIDCAAYLGEPINDQMVATWLIYLNKTCFNGLYRVNKKGEFNVPFGKYENPKICDTDTLKECSHLLQRSATIMHGDFELIVERAEPGDFVYFDPPYVPSSKTSNFVAYDKTGFAEKDHVRLRDCALRLKQRGVHVLLTNSVAPLVEELYAEHFEMAPVMAKRAINSKGDRRGPVKEWIIK